MIEDGTRTGYLSIPDSDDWIFGTGRTGRGMRIEEDGRRMNIDIVEHDREMRIVERVEQLLRGCRFSEEAYRRLRYIIDCAKNPTEIEKYRLWISEKKEQMYMEKLMQKTREIQDYEHRVEDYYEHRAVEREMKIDVPMPIPIPIPMPKRSEPFIEEEEMKI